MKMVTPAMSGPVSIALIASSSCCEYTVDLHIGRVPEPVPVLADLEKDTANTGNGKIKHDKNEIIVMA